MGSVLVEAQGWCDPAAARRVAEPGTGGHWHCILPLVYLLNEDQAHLVVEIMLGV